MSLVIASPPSPGSPLAAGLDAPEAVDVGCGELASEEAAVAAGAVPSGLDGVDGAPPHAASANATRSMVSDRGRLAIIGLRRTCDEHETRRGSPTLRPVA
jgi:hypothetical protein